MGVDIHMCIVTKDNYIVKDNIFEGERDYRWFDNISNQEDDLYRGFPFGYNEFPGMDISAIIPNYEELWYYNLRHINAQDFIDWCDKVRPWVDAGWVSTYEKFLYERKKIYPHDFCHYLSVDCNVADYHFIEIFDECDMTLRLYNLVNDLPPIYDRKDLYIVYYFDH